MMYRANIQFKTNAFRHFQLVLSLLETIESAFLKSSKTDFCKKSMSSFSASNTTQQNRCFTYEVSFHHNQDVDPDVCVFERCLINKWP